MKYVGRYILRTVLFTAGHNEKYINKAFESDADTIVLDLEDAVPANKKAEARKKIMEVLKVNTDKRPIFVRINPLESGDTLKDLDEVACEKLSGFVYPKVYNAEDIKVFDAQLSLKEKNLNLPKGYFDIIALIETPEAVLNVHEIARSSKRMKALLFGCEDFLADMEGEHGMEGRSLLVPRHLVSMAARAAGIIPIDTPYVKIGDFEGLKLHIQQAKELGYEGMLVMTPKEIPIVKEKYSPSKEEVEKAKKLVLFSLETNEANKGIAVVDNIFVSPPTLSRANKLLARHENIIKFESYLKE
ncbi:MAG TPA: CoA ester lyase [Bacteroidales bacterium]|nr:MAG: citrate lyase beta chain [Bacteroidetes bacterium GWF2_33_38]OFY89237.1 MAG: citrate lyase beta chain [Bacteroidetes bacterium RIFOXYA2_FULL_33_7]HBF87362.1 CoA ester lyase [Bacteroidales bacterium]